MNDMLIDELAEAIKNAMYWNGTVMCTGPEALAKAALAVLHPRLKAAEEMRRVINYALTCPFSAATVDALRSAGKEWDDAALAKVESN